MSAQERKPKILVVEDDEAILNVLSLFLSYAHFEVRGARSGKEAMELVPSFGPQLIVLDLNMRPISGWEVLHWLRASKLSPPIRVLVLTASTRLSEQVRGLEGAVDYLTKPTQPSVLVERIRSILAMSDEALLSLLQKRLQEQRRVLEQLVQAGKDEKMNVSIKTY
ncbi:response regulator transcription factor [Thermogemmatispora carboxidivorans]|uniref:response regulator transcription factor n=1 Tax=Thermogemmatispora carboxidivorans TaxID=1382306 RepID=UPI00069B0B42|nr:response regulator [Thermogemmatispora carboxidivorans]